MREREKVIQNKSQSEQESDGETGLEARRKREEEKAYRDP